MIIENNKNLDKFEEFPFNDLPTMKDFFSKSDKIWNPLFDKGWIKIDNSRVGLTIPAVNIAEEEDSYVLSLAAPGMKKEDISIEVSHKTISISSKKEDQKEEKGKKYTRKEFSYASFMRSFPLPANVNGASVTAKYEDGILYIYLPKKKGENISSKKVTIE
ncbi:MAG: Hsp20/alpha crystallin family protein [Bacteroidota bacterium]